MSRYDIDENEDVELDMCDCCHKSMTHNELAYISDEDHFDMDMEIVNWLSSMKYEHLCHKCFSKVMEKTTKEA